MIQPGQRVARYRDGDRMKLGEGTVVSVTFSQSDFPKYEISWDDRYRETLSEYHFKKQKPGRVLFRFLPMRNQLS